MWQTKSQKAEAERKLAAKNAEAMLEDALTSFSKIANSDAIIAYFKQRQAYIGQVMRANIGKSEIVGLAAQYNEIEDTIKFLTKKSK